MEFSETVANGIKFQACALSLQSIEMDRLCHHGVDWWYFRHQTARTRRDCNHHALPNHQGSLDRHAFGNPSSRAQSESMPLCRQWQKLDGLYLSSWGNVVPNVRVSKPNSLLEFSHSMFPLANMSILGADATLGIVRANALRKRDGTLL